MTTPRYHILDGFRGFFLVFMAIVHGNVFDSVFGKLNHHYIGWVEDAQGFVFISGLVVGLVYGKILATKSARQMSAALRRRMLTIYRYQAGLILGMLAVALAMGSQVPAILANYSAEPVSFTVTSLLLVSASSNMGILPMYLFFMMATPWALREFHARGAVLVFGVSAVLWLFAQTGLLELGLAAIKAQTGLKLGIFFNVFGWQVLYFSGLYFGYRLATNSLDLAFLRTPAAANLFFVSLLAIGVLALYDRLVFDQWISATFSGDFLAANRRTLFGPIYVVAFFVDLFAVSWLLVSGPDSPLKIVRIASSLVRRVFTTPFLVFLGQHSLQVFAFHIVAVYALSGLLNGREISDAIGGLILAALVVSLLLPAWLHARSGAWTIRLRPVSVRAAEG